MAGGNGAARRVDLANRVERAVSAALTAELFGDEDQQPGEEIMPAAMRVIRSQGHDDEAAAVLTRHGWGSPLLHRAPAQTLLADVAGSLSSPSAAGSVPDEVIARVRQRHASTQRLIDALTVDLPLNALPWVPAAPAPPGSFSLQSAELTELPSRTISVTGEYVEPTPIGRAANLAWQLGDAADAVLEIIASDALWSVGQWLDAELAAAAGTASADVNAAITAVESAEWAPDLIVTPLSKVGSVSAALGEVAASALADVALIVAPVSNVYVIARAGVDARLSEQATARIAEPSIGAQEISVTFWGIFRAGAGAVERVA